MKKALIANIFGIGDVLFTTPLVSNLKKAYPGIEVCYLCNARVRDLLKSEPDVDSTYVYEKDELVRLWRRSKTSGMREVVRLFRWVSRGKFDAVFDFTLSRGFGFLFTLAGVPRRIGLNYRKRGIFLTEKIDFTGFEGKHVIEYYLDLLRRAGIEAPVSEMKLVPEGRALSWAEKFLADHNMKGRPIVAIVPGGGASWGEMSHWKRWDADNFAAAAEELSRKGCSILVAGDSTERSLCEKTANKVRNSPSCAVTELPISHYIAILSLCDMVLCNDGGPLHIASALGVKTVSIFGPVDDEVYGPYPVSEKHRVVKAFDVVCRPCYRKFRVPECRDNRACLRIISVEEVVAACGEVLGLGRGK